MYKKAVTVKDVATEANVSTATVSAVMSASRTNNVRISEATRRHVLATAQRLKYQPNATARSLQRRHTNVIGFYGGVNYHVIAHHHITDGMLGGMQEGCSGIGKNLLLYDTSRDKSEAKVLAELVNGRVDGLVAWVNHLDPIVRQLRDYGVPVVAMLDGIDGIPSVVADDVGGARMLIEYLHDKGHERLAFCQADSYSTSILHRHQSIVGAAKERGLSVMECPPIIYGTDGSGHIVPDDEFDWLKLPRSQRPTAYVGAFDEIASFAVEHCVREQVRIPDDLAVVGFDGTVQSRLGAPILTTVKVPMRLVGKMAVNLLNDMLEGRDVPVETILPVELLVGDTA
jgi:DNA-binding LacI/PurR family transcriptional regulator